MNRSWKYVHRNEYTVARRFNLLSSRLFVSTPIWTQQCTLKSIFTIKDFAKAVDHQIFTKFPYIKHVVKKIKNYSTTPRFFRCSDKITRNMCPFRIHPLKINHCGMYELVVIIGCWLFYNIALPVKWHFLIDKGLSFRQQEITRYDSNKLKIFTSSPMNRKDY